MKVYIVVVENWNGETDVKSVAWVMSSENAANERANALNSKNLSAYSPIYSVEEWEVEN